MGECCEMEWAMEISNYCPPERYFQQEQPSFTWTRVYLGVAWPVTGGIWDRHQQKMSTEAAEIARGDASIIRG